MIKVFDINNNKCAPKRKEILKLQGIPENAKLPDNVNKVIDNSMSLYIKLAEIKGKIVSINKNEFLKVSFLLFS